MLARVPGTQCAVRDLALDNGASPVVNGGANLFRADGAGSERNYRITGDWSYAGVCMKSNERAM
jgi:hypothetical protein